MFLPKGRVETQHSFDKSTKSLIVNLAKANWSSSANIIFSHSDLMTEIGKPLRKKVSFERKEYSKSDSVLKCTTPSELLSLSNKTFVTERFLKCPLLKSVMLGAVDCEDIRPSEISVKKLNSIALSSSVLARCRNQNMTALSYRISTGLAHNGARHADIRRLQRLRVCVLPDSAIRGGSSRIFLRLAKQAFKSSRSTHLVLAIIISPCFHPALSNISAPRICIDGWNQLQTHRRHFMICIRQLDDFIKVWQ